MMSLQSGPITNLPRPHQTFLTDEDDKPAVGFSHFDYGKSRHRDDSLETPAVQKKGTTTPMTRASSADPTRSVSPAYLSRDKSRGSGARVHSPPMPSAQSTPTLPPPRP